MRNRGSGPVQPCLYTTSAYGSSSISPKAHILVLVSRRNKGGTGHLLSVKSESDNSRAILSLRDRAYKDMHPRSDGVVAWRRKAHSHLELLPTRSGFRSLVDTATGARQRVFSNMMVQGIEPSFCVSAQWKISWYSLGLSSFVAMLDLVAARAVIVRFRRGDRCAIYGGDCKSSVI
jgi:hypothetical protein